jgi:hypothetical protein
MNNFESGEQVTILNETGTYIFVRLNKGKAVIEDEHGFEREIEFNFLVRRRKIEVKTTSLKGKDDSILQSIEDGIKVLPEIDLHIENLLEHSSAMSAHEKFTCQINAFKQFTNEMLRQRKTRFRVVHGIGEGRLKSEIRTMIQGKIGFQMHDDNIVNGKVGASLIEIQVTKAERF